MSNNTLNESIGNNDLRNLVGNLVSIDQYKSKIGQDENVIVLAVKVSGVDPAKDLSQFIESGFNAIDVDVSPGPDEDGNYTVFVEIDRNSQAFEKIQVILEDVNRVDNEVDQWMFVSYRNDMPVEFNEENFNEHVISNSYDYVITYDDNAKQLSERINFLNKY